jgi:hypothetical protein
MVRILGLAGGGCVGRVAGGSVGCRWADALLRWQRTARRARSLPHSLPHSLHALHCSPPPPPPAPPPPPPPPPPSFAHSDPPLLPSFTLPLAQLYARSGDGADLPRHARPARLAGAGPQRHQQRALRPFRGQHALAQGRDEHGGAAGRSAGRAAPPCSWRSRAALRMEECSSGVRRGWCSEQSGAAGWAVSPTPLPPLQVRPGRFISARRGRGGGQVRHSG